MPSCITGPGRPLGDRSPDGGFGLGPSDPYQGPRPGAGFSPDSAGETQDQATSGDYVESLTGRDQILATD